MPIVNVPFIDESIYPKGMRRAINLAYSLVYFNGYLTEVTKRESRDLIIENLGIVIELNKDKIDGDFKAHGDACNELGIIAGIGPDGIIELNDKTINKCEDFIKKWITDGLLDSSC